MLTRARFIATAASGLALALGLGGCSPLGIEDPAASPSDATGSGKGDAPAGSVDFESLVVSVNTDASTWQWDQVQNPRSETNGLLVVGLPVTATNNDDRNRVLNSQYCKVLAPDGTAQPDITGSYPDDILKRGGIAAGQTESGTLHVLFRGTGTYTLAFNDLLGGKAELPVRIDSSATGLRAIPDEMGAHDVSGAVPAGAAFDAEGLTMTFSANEASYCWLQASAPGDPVWDGRWCVGVPLTVVNHSSAGAAVTQDVYAKFNPWLDRQADPAPHFAAAPYADAGGIAGMNDIATAGLVSAGQSIASMMWWAYDGDGDYYVVFDSAGAKVIASVHIAQYE